MKIIFLDIDGVLNVIPERFDNFGGCFHENFVENLRNIIEKTDAKIVVSSSWRLSGLKIMQEMWKDRKLPGDVIDVTPDLYYGEDAMGNRIGRDMCRGDEIQHWLDRHDIESYVILDDDTDFLESQNKNFVRCSCDNFDDDCIDIGYGLTKRRAELAIKVLQNI
jgi:hypothetical protein